MTASAPLARPNLSFLLAHPAHFIALGFGAGLSPRAPGTAGTLWAWAAYLALQWWFTPGQIGWIIAASLPLGWWASTVAARNMRVLDPGSIVWDEVVAFWIVLWLVTPAGLWTQLAAFVLFRYFDAAKPGPVGWADRRFKLQPGQPIGWRQGFGILFDDLVAALCTLLVMAVGVRLWTS